MVELTAVKWLYCFACHTSQEHELCDDGNYKCPNCGMVGKWYLPDVRPGGQSNEKLGGEEITRIAQLAGEEGASVYDHISRCCGALG